MDKEAFKKRMYELYEEAGIGVNDEKQIDADSFNYICLISSIEEEFNVELPDEFLIFTNFTDVDVFIDSVYDLIK